MLAGVPPGQRGDEKTAVWDGDGLQRLPYMACHLASVAGLALAAPVCNIRAHTLPHKPGFDEPFCGPHPWMSQVVYAVEQQPTVKGGHQRAAPVDVSHSNDTPSTSNVFTWREEVSAACCVDVQATCAEAMGAKSMTSPAVLAGTGQEATAMVLWASPKTGSASTGALSPPDVVATLEFVLPP